jgi:hypothetical protein
VWAGLSGLEERELAKIEEDTRELTNEDKMKECVNV